jgi:hypothetical protein
MNLRYFGIFHFRKFNLTIYVVAKLSPLEGIEGVKMTTNLLLRSSEMVLHSLLQFLPTQQLVTTEVGLSWRNHFPIRIVGSRTAVHLLISVVSLSKARDDTGNVRQGDTDGSSICWLAGTSADTLKGESSFTSGPRGAVHNAGIMTQCRGRSIHDEPNGRNIVVVGGIHVLIASMIARVVDADQSANSHSSFLHPLYHSVAPQNGIARKSDLMALYDFAACAGMSACVAIAANLWLGFARFNLRDLLRLIAVGVCPGLFSHFGTICLVVSLFIAMSTMDCAGITHLFSLSVKVFSLASDYIIASFGSAVNHYLSFNRRGATAFQVLLPRQLFTYFAGVVGTSPLSPLVFRIVIEYLLYICFTPCIFNPVIGPNFTSSFWLSSAIVLQSNKVRLNQSAKPELALLLLHAN